MLSAIVSKCAWGIEDYSKDTSKMMCFFCEGGFWNRQSLAIGAGWLQ